ncbi:hypothetical protein MUO74_09970, partial [Candidatus Bathyarchaeota archaeon]|nr:hypothetical protein [Candidatus Bathyarchaeota archaeon]
SADYQRTMFFHDFNLRFWRRLLKTELNLSLAVEDLTSSHVMRECLFTTKKYDLHQSMKTEG